MKRQFFTLLSFLFAVSCSFAQLSGTYTIGGTSPDYPTFQAAISDLDSAGISGSVIFNVRNGTYNETFTIGQITGTGPGATITFQSESGDSTDVTLEYENDGINPNWILSDAAYITFKALTFNNTSTTMHYYQCQLQGNCTNINFENCHFMTANPSLDDLVRVNTDSSNGISFSNNYFESCHGAIRFAPLSDSIYNVTVLNNTFDNIKYPIDGDQVTSISIRNNDFVVNARNPVYLRHSTNLEVLSNKFDTIINTGIFFEFCGGSLAASYNEFNDYTNYGIAGTYLTGPIVITNNDFNAYSKNAIDVSDFTNATVENNVVSISTFNGILLSNGLSGRVSGNEVHNPSVKGIYVYYVYGAVTVSENKIMAFNEYGTAYGIGVDNVFPGSNETVVVTNNQIFSRYEDTGLYVEELSGHSGKRGVVANNMVSGFETNLNIKQSKEVVCAYNSLSTFAEGINAVFAEQDTNVSFSNNIISYWSIAPGFDVISLADTFDLHMDYNVYNYNWAAFGANLTSFAETMQEHNAFGMGLHSLAPDVDPTFFNDTTDLRICNDQIAQVGTPVAEVMLDLFGTPRDASTPTPGAYEFRPVIASYVSTSSNGQATFTNTSSSNATSFIWDFGDESSTSTEENPVHQYGFNGTYDVRLIAYNNCSRDTSIQQITITEAVGIAETGEVKMKIYPNPNDGLFYVETVDGKTDLNVYDLAGHLIFHQPLFTGQKQQINLGEVAKGLYLVEVKSASGRALRQIVIQ